WNNVCTPLVWRKLWLGGNVPKKLPRLEHMLAYGDDDEDDEVSDSSSLGSGGTEDGGEDIELKEERTCPRSVDLFNLILRNQSTLKTFENHWSTRSITQKVLCAVLSCPNLERLITTTVTYKNESREMLFKVGPQLKTFYSINDYITLDYPQNPLIFESEWSNINSLSFQYPNMNHEPQFVVDVVKNCPQIQMFTWDTLASIPVDDLVDQVFPSCKKLDSLQIQNTKLSDQDVSKILKAMKHVRLLKIRSDINEGPGQLSLDSLRNHFLTLESVYFTCAQIKSHHVQEILSSCPGLKSIQANEISVKDIRDGSPWVCTGLTSFCIRVVGVKNKDGDYKTVYGQLSKLKQLYELDIHIDAYHEEDEVEDGLRLSLKYDLSELSELTNLRYISVANTYQEVTVKDVEWILKHWKGLEVWEGNLHENRTSNTTSATKLAKAGVKWMSYDSDDISSATLSSVLGVYFGLWLAFSLFVRFVVPSPNIEPSLPVYTPSPSVPQELHSPNRPDAQPVTSAIRHNTSSTGVKVLTNRVGAKGGPRFEEIGKELQEEQQQQQQQQKTRNVTFQTRPRAGTTDSTSSMVFPTFLDYRQSQNNSMDAFAQRIKRAFVLSRREQEQARIEEELKRQQLEEEQEEEEERLRLQEQEQQSQQEIRLQPRNTGRLRSSSNVLPVTSSSVPKQGTNRLRSSSTASMFSDIAERIKNGSLFKRSASAMSNPVGDEERVDNNPFRLDEQTPMSSNPSGIEIMVTSSEDDYPFPDGYEDAKIIAGMDEEFDGKPDLVNSQAHQRFSTPIDNTAMTVTNTATSNNNGDDESRPTYRRTNTREPSPLSSVSNMMTMEQEKAK
ncbi:hypothetical protein BGZ76_003379, partial [Entomortierella beljakovae]